MATAVFSLDSTLERLLEVFATYERDNGHQLFGMYQRVVEVGFINSNAGIRVALEATATQNHIGVFANVLLVGDKLTVKALGVRN